MTPTRRSGTKLAAGAGLLALAASPSGCLAPGIDVAEHGPLTNLLAPDGAPPPIASHHAVMRVAGARGTVADLGRDRALELILRTESAFAGAPAHLRASEDPERTLRFEPPALHGPDWRAQPGMAGFRPRAFAVTRVDTAPYYGLHRYRATLVFVGEVEPERVVRRTRPPADDDLATSDGLRIPGDARLPHEIALRAFRRTQWLELLQDEPRTRVQRAIAFVDADGRPIDPQAIDRLATRDAPQAPLPAAEGFGLLVRAVDTDGGIEWLHVPLPILLQGAHLVLSRAGDRVHWHREQIWYGDRTDRILGRSTDRTTDAQATDPPIPLAALDLDVPLLGNRLLLAHHAEDPHDPPLLVSLARYALGPAAHLLDRIILTNEWVVDMIRVMLGDPGVRPRSADRRR